MTTKPVRLMVFDATCVGRPARPGLSDAWYAGGMLYRALGRFDHARGVRSWSEALTWLSEVDPDRPIAEIQYWGHGNWGRVLVDGERLDASAVEAGHAHRPALERIRARMRPEAQWWFRTCEAFGGDAGHRFARAWTRFFERPAAGHTFIIGYWQSGLHRLGVGERPSWPAEEGLAEGSAADPVRARWSKPWLPHTISCLRGRIPVGW
jgi:hypothetical protein